MSVNPLQPSELEAWFRLMQIEPTPWEVDTLFQMDAAFLERLNTKKSTRKGIAKADINDPQAVTNLMQSFVYRKPNGSMISRGN